MFKFVLQVKNKLTEVHHRLITFRPYNLAGSALNILTPSKGYVFKPNIAYGLKSRQRLDLYLANARHSNPRHSNSRHSNPLIVFVHGGAWTKGSKDDYKFLGQSLTKAGYDVAVINYHLAPQHVFPSYVDDLVDAIEFLDKNQNRLGICTNQLALLGHSAGAFNIMSAVYHPNDFQHEVLSKIKVLIGLAGPYHFNYLGDALAEPAFDAKVPYTEVMPYYFVKKNSIQHFLFLADRDDVVKDQNTLDLAAALKKLENHCEIIRIPKTGHVSIMGSISVLFSPFFDTRHQLIKALNQAFKSYRQI